LTDDMNNPASIQTAVPRKYGVILYLALIAAGLAGNYFKYPIFLNIDFLFGSIFAMLALQFFGLIRGVAAAALIAVVTYFLWRHPYAIIILTAEVAIVGWLTRNSKIGLVLADALYWLVVGMPLVAVFYHGAMDVSVANTTIVMSKQAVNGIANAMLARLIFTGFALRSRSELVAYRDLIYNLLTFFALCPALVLLAVASRADFTQTDHSIRADLYQNSRAMSDRLVVWVRNRSVSIIKLAEAAASLTPQQMQPRLEQALSADINFLRVGLLDKAATTTAYAPMIDELGKSNIGRSFADRPFIPRLKQTLKPILSEVVMGRIGAPKPIVTLLAPVVVEGEFRGYITGILSLDQIRDFLGKSTEADTMRYSLVDKNGNVILSNSQEHRMMEPFVRGNGSLNRLDERISQWVPQLPHNTPVSERWKSSFYVAQSPVGDLAEWTLILEQPVAPFQKILHERYTDALFLLLLMLFIALALAELLSRRVAATTEQLSELTQGLPSRLEQAAPIEWPGTGLLEPRRLIGSFQEMAQQLAEQFRANRELNATLEQRVEERTHALQRSESRFRSMADGAPVLLWIAGLDKQCNYFNQVWLRFTGRTMEEETGNGWAEGVHPEDLDACLATYTSSFDARRQFSMEYRLRRFDGKYRWLLDNGVPLIDDRGAFLGFIGSCIDISEQKENMEELKRSNADLEQFAYAASHDMRQPLRMITSYLQLLAVDLAPLLNEDTRKKFAFATEGAQRMDQMLTALLDYSRVGRQTESLAAIDSRDLVEQALQILQPSVTEAGAGIRIEGDWPQIVAGRDEMLRLFQNLIDNALKYRLEGRKPEVVVAAVTRGAEWRFSVSDNGVGLLPGQEERLFKVFERLQPRSRYPGTGIGLALCRKIVERHGGRIWVESAGENQGCTFIFTLPATHQIQPQGMP
jgi:PAS domain S-box-containing protein